eukprot:1144446-Pelagomonas_calceolata.AAC.4
MLPRPSPVLPASRCVLQVLLKNVMLVSLVECLALGWVSVCAGAALLPTLVHAISLWVVAVLTSAMLDASRCACSWRARIHVCMWLVQALGSAGGHKQFPVLLFAGAPPGPLTLRGN